MYTTVYMRSTATLLESDRSPNVHDGVQEESLMLLWRAHGPLRL